MTDAEIWRLAYEKAEDEATHPSEIEARAIVYYREIKARDAAREPSKETP
jgi:hypothetical protein